MAIVRICFLFGWRCNKLEESKAKYIAILEAIKGGICIYKFIGKLRVVLNIVETITMYCDNNTVIS